MAMSTPQATGQDSWEHCREGSVNSNNNNSNSERTSRAPFYVKHAQLC